MNKVLFSQREKDYKKRVKWLLALSAVLIAIPFILLLLSLYYFLFAKDWNTAVYLLLLSMVFFSGSRITKN